MKLEKKEECYVVLEALRQLQRVLKSVRESSVSVQSGAGSLLSGMEQSRYVRHEQSFLPDTAKPVSEKKTSATAREESTGLGDRREECEVRVDLQTEVAFTIIRDEFVSGDQHW